MNPIIKKFLIRASILFVLWEIVFLFYLVPDGRLNDLLTESVLSGSEYFLRFIGFDAEKLGNIILINKEQMVSVANSCNGLELFALYAGFLIAFPGNVKSKLLYIPLGIVFIHFVNILREVVLVLNYKYYRLSFDFNHHYTYALLVYGLIFLIWKHWINKYSDVAKREEN